MPETKAFDIENTLKDCASKFAFYSVVLDESTDITDTVQLPNKWPLYFQ